MNKIKLSRIFVRAAERIDNGMSQFCCIAVIMLDGEVETFRNIYGKSYGAWWPIEDKQVRVIALLLASEFVKDYP